jgi:hypothetical protein
MGFVLSTEEAQALIARDGRNKEVIFPYLNGEDLNSRPDQSPSRYVINFRDWPLNRSAEGSWHKASKQERKVWLQKGSVPNDFPGPVATDYPDLLEIVVNKVKAEREKNKYSKSAREKWWLFERHRPELYQTIEPFQKVVITARVSPTCAVTWLKTGIVFHEKIVVFSADSSHFFAVMQSTLHWEWARQYTSTLGAITLNYSPSDCFETFPFPKELEGLSSIGEKYYLHRQSVMQSRQEGMTKTYNRLNNPDEQISDITSLRELHTAMDITVAAAYGWRDIKLDHGFCDTNQGIRFTICEAARREILDRLLALNHERYAEEVAVGLHEKSNRSGKKKSRRKKSEEFHGQQLSMIQ